jgi:hypothetical protein
LGEELGQVLGYAPKFTRKEFQLTQKFAPKFSAQDIALARQYGPQYAQTGFDISKQFAPQYQQLNLAQMRRNIAAQPILGTLNEQALSQLQAGGRLTPGEAREVEQQTRAGFAARGNVMGNQALGTELLNRDIYSQQKLRQAEQFASGVQQLNLAQLVGLGGVAQPPNFPAYAAPGGGYQPMAAGLGAAGAVVNPLLSYESQLQQANQNAAAAQSAAAANKSSGLLGGGLGAIGSIGGGLAMGL